MQVVSKRLKAVDVLVITALILAYSDETIRKLLPGAPVIVTGIKDFLLIGAAFMVLNIKNHQRMLAPFVPWIIYSALSAIYIHLNDKSYLHLLLTLKVYTFGIFIVVVGSYISTNRILLIRVGIILLVGSVLAFCIALLQEHMQSVLPTVFNLKGYKIKHSMAGGDYVESIFSSPQTFAVSMVILLYLSLYKYLTAKNKWNKIYLTLIAISIYGLYMARIRVAVVLALLGVGLIILIFLAPSMKRKIITTSVAILILLIPIYFMVPNKVETAIEAEIGERDRVFYSELLSTEVIMARVTYGLKGTSSDSDYWLLGYGSGTSGQLRAFLNSEWKVGPGAYDSGWTQFYYQFGLLGTLLFVAPFIYRLSRLSRQEIVSNTSIFLGKIVLVFCWVLLIWAIVKSNSIVVNSFSSMLLYLSFGYVTGMGLQRRRWMRYSRHVSRIG